MSETFDASVRASDPTVSAWVAANAGSGKTHVLVQRVIRAYEGYGRQQQELPLAMGDGERDPKGEPARVVRPTQ